MDTRKCNKCNKTKPLDKFERTWCYKKINRVKTNTKLYFYRWSCRECVAKDRARPRSIRKDHPLLRDTRKCKTCRKTMPLNENNFRKKFHYKKVNKVKTNIKLINFAKECLDCVKINVDQPRWAEWYLKNKEKILSFEKNHRFEMKQKAVEYKGGRCVDCVKQGRDGVFPTCAYSFHHTNPTEKEHDPSKLMKRKKWESIKEEIDKCVLLCLNCHGIRHYTGEL